MSCSKGPTQRSCNCGRASEVLRAQSQRRLRGPGQACEESEHAAKLPQAAGAAWGRAQRGAAAEAR
eukprot:12601524-Alexandrium_andersonii.AAC.1